MFKTKKNKFAFLDERFRLEINFFEKSTGDGAEARVEQRILKCLPDSVSRYYPTIAQSLGDLKALLASKLVKFVGYRMKSRLEAIVAWCTTLSKQNSPRFEASVTDFLTMVKDRLALFCVSSAGSSAAEVRGAESAKEKYNVVAALAANGQRNNDNMKEVLTFRWLLTSEQKTNVKVRGTAASTPKPSTSLAAASGSEPKKKAAPKKKVDPKQLVADLLS